MNLFFVSLCTFEQLCLRSVCSHFELNRRLVCVRKGTEELYFRLYLDEGVIIIIFPPVFSTETEITDNYHISSRDINVVDIFVSHCKW